MVGGPGQRRICPALAPRTKVPSARTARPRYAHAGHHVLLPRSRRNGPPSPSTPRPVLPFPPRQAHARSPLPVRGRGVGGEGSERLARNPTIRPGGNHFDHLPTTTPSALRLPPV